jgi:hypothetical protein
MDSQTISAQTGIRTQGTGFKVPGANHYTIRAKKDCLYVGTINKSICSGTGSNRRPSAHKTDALTKLSYKNKKSSL